MVATSEFSGETMDYVIRRLPITTSPLDIIEYRDYIYSFEMRQGRSLRAAMSYRRESYWTKQGEIRAATLEEVDAAGFDSKYRYPVFVLGEQYKFILMENETQIQAWKELPPIRP